jgi:hypothetical protein
MNRGKQVGDEVRGENNPLIKKQLRNYKKRHHRHDLAWLRSVRFDQLEAV